jgi:hypothetical protein
VVVAAGVVIWVHPIPSWVKSFTTAPSKLTTTWAGKVTAGGIVHVIKDVFVGFTVQLLSWSAMTTVSVLPVRSGAGVTILKLIKFEPVSHIVTWPVNSGDPEVGEVGEIDIAAVAVASKVAVSAGVGELATRVGAGVNVAGTTPQNKRSRSPFVAEKDGSVSKSTTVTPSGHV